MTSPPFGLDVHRSKLLRSTVAAHGLEAILGTNDVPVLLRRDSLHAVLRQQSLASREGARRHTSTLIDDAIMVAGWLPCRNKRWPIASDKLAFMVFARVVVDQDEDRNPRPLLFLAVVMFACSICLTSNRNE